MPQLLDWFRTRRSAAPVAAKSQRPTRLGLETLEERKVLSTASANIHAVTDAYGHSAVFYIDPNNHAFYEVDAYHGKRMLSGANTVQSLTAGVDSHGYADAFVKAGDNSFWEYNYRGWHQVLGPNYVKDFAAVKGDRVYFENWDDSLWQFQDLHGFHQMSGPGTVQTLDAVTDNLGRDAVFAIRGDHSFQELFQGSWHQLSGAYTIQKGFSAGTDTAGNADVYGVAGDNSFWKWDNGWARLANAGVVSQFSATNSGQCWYIAPNGSLNKFDGNNNVHNVWNGSFTQISAAASNDVYVVNWDKSLWERTGGGVWHHIN
jgi:hypothetical protein